MRSWRTASTIKRLFQHARTVQNIFLSIHLGNIFPVPASKDKQIVVWEKEGSIVTWKYLASTDTCELMTCFNSCLCKTLLLTMDHFLRFTRRISAAITTCWKSTLWIFLPGSFHLLKTTGCQPWPRTIQEYQIILSNMIGSFSWNHVVSLMAFTMGWRHGQPIANHPAAICKAAFALLAITCNFFPDELYTRGEGKRRWRSARFIKVSGVVVHFYNFGSACLYMYIWIHLTCVQDWAYLEGGKLLDLARHMVNITYRTVQARTSHWYSSI